MCMMYGTTGAAAVPIDIIKYETDTQKAILMIDANAANMVRALTFVSNYKEQKVHIAVLRVSISLSGLAFNDESEEFENHLTNI